MEISGKCGDKKTVLYLSDNRPHLEKGQYRQTFLRLLIKQRLS